MFSMESTILQVYLNNEPIFSYRPGILTSSTPPVPVAAAIHTVPLLQSNSSHSSNKEGKESQYYLQRYRHSIGEVTSVCIDEIVSLPPHCTLAVRYYSSQLSQGFFSIQKI
jgi:hypothetical protein